MKRQWSKKLDRFIKLQKLYWILNLSSFLETFALNFDDEIGVQYCANNVNIQPPPEVKALYGPRPFPG